MTDGRIDDGRGVLLHLLAGLRDGVTLDAEGGELRFAGFAGVPVGWLDDLEARGWVDLSGEVPRPTAAGLYWLGRYEADRARAKGFRGRRARLLRVEFVALRRDGEGGDG